VGGHEKLLERYAEVTERFKHLGGYEIDARVADVLKGLGFSLEDQQRKTEEFSGGWQMRIALAKLLLARPNLLLMDEPTNHSTSPPATGSRNTWRSTRARWCWSPTTATSSTPR